MLQLVGTQFTNASAVFGNDVATFPDFPAEIRAPAGSLAGVSGFQVNFSSHDVHTPGDRVNALIAMNPAALKTNIRDVEVGGIVIVNEDAFDKSDLTKAGYTANPLEDGSLSGFRIFQLPITSLTLKALEGSSLPFKQQDRCKNFYALGLMYWLYDRPLETTLRWIDEKFSKTPDVATANALAVKAGYNYADTTEIFTTHYRVGKAKIKPGKYRNITGNEATAIGFVTAAELAGRPLFYGSYPIKKVTLLGGVQRGRDDLATGGRFTSLGAYGEATVPVFNDITFAGVRYDWFDPARRKSNNEIQGLTAYINAWYRDMFRFVVEYQRRNQQRGLLADKNDNAFQVRLIFIK